MKPKTRHLLMGLCLAVILVCGAIIVCDQIATNRAQSYEDGVRELYKPASRFRFSLIASASAQVDWEVEEEKDEGDTYTVQDDFNALLAVNEDTVGWVTAGDRIDGPVVYRDNEYYLTHNFYGEADKQGCLFLNESCGIDPKDTVLMIHGHNLRSQGMLGSLSSFSDYSYVKQYPVINFRTIYDADPVYYAIFSAFHASMLPDDPTYFDVMEIAFENKEAHQRYLNKALKRSLWKSPVDVDLDDEMVMLITCDYNDEEGRFILLGRKLRQGETPESVAALFK